MDFFLLQMKGGEKDGDGERNGVSRENATCPNGKEQYQQGKKFYFQDCKRILQTMESKKSPNPKNYLKST